MTRTVPLYEQLPTVDDIASRIRVGREYVEVKNPPRFLDVVAPGSRDYALMDVHGRGFTDDRGTGMRLFGAIKRASPAGIDANLTVPQLWEEEIRYDPNYGVFDLYAYTSMPKYGYVATIAWNHRFYDQPQTTVHRAVTGTRPSQVFGRGNLHPSGTRLMDWIDFPEGTTNLHLPPQRELHKRLGANIIRNASGLPLLPAVVDHARI